MGRFSHNCVGNVDLRPTTVAPTARGVLNTQAPTLEPILSLIYLADAKETRSLFPHLPATHHLLALRLLDLRGCRQ